MNDPLPENLAKYFWDCHFHELNMENHSFFITERILNFGDMESLKWLLAQIDEDFLKKIVEKSRNLDKKTRNYWQLLLKDHNFET